MVSLEKAGRLQNPFFLSHPPSDSLFTRILASPSIPEAVILTNGNQFARIDARTGSCTCNGSPRSDNTTHSPTSSLVQPSISPSFEPPVFSAAFSSKKLHSLLYSQHESLSCIVEGGHRVAGVPRPPLLVQAVGTVQVGCNNLRGMVIQSRRKHYVLWMGLGLSFGKIVRYYVFPFVKVLFN